MINTVFLVCVGLANCIFLMFQMRNYVDSFLSLVGAFTISTAFGLFVSTVVWIILQLNA